MLRAGLTGVHSYKLACRDELLANRNVAFRAASMPVLRDNRAAVLCNYFDGPWLSSLWCKKCQFGTHFSSWVQVPILPRCRAPGGTFAPATLCPPLVVNNSVPDTLHPHPSPPPRLGLSLQPFTFPSHIPEEHHRRASSHTQSAFARPPSSK